MSRVRGLRANALCKSHDELNDSTELDRGDIYELGRLNHEHKKAFPHLNVFGGCCGTDHEHVWTIAREIAQPAGI